MSDEVAEAVAQEKRTRNVVRDGDLPEARLAARPLPSRQVSYQATPVQIEQKHRGILLNGKIEACDGYGSHS